MSSFYDAVIAAETHPMKEFEKAIFFEGCLPIEELARRGKKTLCFGPMKPVRFDRSSDWQRRPFAVVQLRQDNLAASHYNMVGFQTSMRFSEQARVFRMIPGLRKCRIYSLWMDPSEYVSECSKNSVSSYQTQHEPITFFCRTTFRRRRLCRFRCFRIACRNQCRATCSWICLYKSRQPHTAMGALAHYISNADPDHFQPMNITFGFFMLRIFK